MSNRQIKPDELVWIKGRTYPFYFNGVNKKGKPMVWGDFSDGMCGYYGYIESEVEWDDVIYPIPQKNISNESNSNESNSNSLIDPQNISGVMNTMNPLSPLNYFRAYPGRTCD